MADRTVFDVVPDGDRWKVNERKGSRSRQHATKEQAVEDARALADESKPSQIVIHNADGRIEKERTYGDDPFPPAG